MKISQVTEEMLLNYIKEDITPETTQQMSVIKASALSYISSYTNIPFILDEGQEGETLDDYEDITIAFMVLCQHMYDNRSYTADSKEVNRVIDSILSLHSGNLVG